MNNTKTQLDHLADKVMASLLSKVIYNNEYGHYVLFDQYLIMKENGYFKVFRRRDEHIVEFANLRNATVWSILDKYTKISEATRVLDLDQKLDSLKAEILVHSRFKNNDFEIQRDKLLNDLHKQKRFQWELDKYIIMAKICQERGFKNEFTRTS